MKALINQILKFGVVGVICFSIDFVIFLVLTNIFEVHYIIAAFFGFTVSVIVNYILSMKYVFVRKEDMDRRKEFIIFVVLSVFGLMINELVMFVCMEGIYAHWAWLNRLIGERPAEAVSKIGATGVVMVFNFITRKIFLEKKEPEQ